MLGCKPSGGAWTDKTGRYSDAAPYRRNGGERQFQNGRRVPLDDARVLYGMLHPAVQDWLDDTILEVAASAVKVPDPCTAIFPDGTTSSYNWVPGEATIET